LTPTLATSTAE